jgi:hypothetical protein
MLHRFTSVRSPQRNYNRRANLDLVYFALLSLCFCLYVYLSTLAENHLKSWFALENPITLLSTYKLARLTLFALRQSGCLTKAHLLLGLEPSDI